MKHILSPLVLALGLFLWGCESKVELDTPPKLAQEDKENQEDKDNQQDEENQEDEDNQDDQEPEQGEDPQDELATSLEGLTASIISSSSLAISWSEAQGFSHYLLERSTNPSTGFVSLNEQLISSTSYEDTGLESSLSYFYRVTACLSALQDSCSLVSQVREAKIPQSLEDFLIDRVEKIDFQSNRVYLTSHQEDTDYSLQYSYQNAANGFISLAITPTQAASGFFVDVVHKDLIDLPAEVFYRVTACSTSNELQNCQSTQVLSASLLRLEDALAANPLAKHQWYYQNTSQKAFAGDFGTTGMDMRVDEVHLAGYSGKGVGIMVVDDGVEAAHPDLNIQQQYSYNFNSQTNNSQPTNSDSNHGTSVSGIIGMKNNLIGGVGVAPGVRIYSRNFLENTCENCYYTSLGLIDSPSNLAFPDLPIDIFNNSWGVNSISPLEFDAFDAEFIDSTAPKGRNNKGYIYSKSAGNGFRSLKDANCSTARSRGLSCQNSAFELQNSHPHFIVTGSYNSLGEASSFSSSGPNLWVSAPGGEFGLWTNRKKVFSDTLGPISTQSYIHSYYFAGTITTDRPGCSLGYSNENDISYSDFDYGWEPIPANNSGAVLLTPGYENYSQKTGAHQLNQTCDYTSTFTGTSAAAPALSGVIALILEANPDLTWRDVRRILAFTAINDERDQTVAYQPITHSVDLSSSAATNLVIDLAWVENAAGYRHNTRYGFGKVDAWAAVEMAKNYHLYPSLSGEYVQYQFTAENADAFTSNEFLQSTSLELQVDQNLALEYARALVTFNHTNIEKTLLVLTSPHGTKSILHWPIDGDNTSASFDSAAFGAAGFFGESSIGTWTLTLYDLGANLGSLEDGLSLELHLMGAAIE